MASLPRCITGRYHYDALDRLVSTAVESQSTVQRFYRKRLLVTELQDVIRHSLVCLDERVVAWQRHLAERSETDLLAIDRQGSMLQALGPQGAQIQAYTAYGHASAGSGLASLLGFNGERCDPLTGHYLLGNGYRAFNPVLMRFNSPDNLSPFGAGGLNAFAYCQGDPVNRQDSQGHMPWPQPAALFLPDAIPLRSFNNAFSRYQPHVAILNADSSAVLSPISVKPVSDRQFFHSLRNSIYAGSASLPDNLRGITPESISVPWVKLLKRSEVKGITNTVTTRLANINKGTVWNVFNAHVMNLYTYEALLKYHASKPSVTGGTRRINMYSNLIWQTKSAIAELNRQAAVSSLKPVSSLAAQVRGKQA